MVQFPELAPRAYEFSARWLDMTPAGFPHSEIPGSAPACGFPRLIAACYVLHRLPTPRHPLYALSSLANVLYQRICGITRSPIFKELLDHLIRSIPEALKLRHGTNFGGDERARTADPLRARQVLSQLSYIPDKWWA